MMLSSVIVVIISVLVLMCPAAEGSTVLIDPGPVCSGHTVALTCSVVEGESVTWFYEGEPVGQTVSPSNPPPSDPVAEGGVQFTLSLTQNSTHLLSKLNFTASTDMVGQEVRCLGFSSGAFSSNEIMLQVELICKYYCHIQCFLLSRSNF